jgi:hypothetical protein
LAQFRVTGDQVHQADELAGFALNARPSGGSVLEKSRRDAMSINYSGMVAQITSKLRTALAELASRLIPAACAASMLVMPACVAGQALGREAEIPIPPTPASVKDILYARPFTLGTPYRYTWTKEPRMVSTGVLVVLEVEPAYVVPRDSLEPVLYAGNVAVHRLNHGHRSGRVIGIIPDNVDLATAPIWFGSPELPGRVTRAMIETEREAAEKAGVRPFPPARISGVQRPAVAGKDLAELLRTVGAQLVYEFSPQEKELAESWRLPVAKAPPRKKTD